MSDRGGHENVWSVRTEAVAAFPIAGARREPGQDKESAGGVPPKTAVGSTEMELEK